MATFFHLIFPFFLAFGSSVVLTVSIIDLARKKELFDANNSLKLHAEQVCSLGGIAIFSAFWITIGLAGERAFFTELGCLFAGSFLLFLTGVKDDLVNMSAFVRLLVQVGVASLLFWGGFRLQYLPGTDLLLPVAASYFLTILLIGAIVNAYNFIDGINGLAGGLAMVASLSLALLFSIAGQQTYTLLSLALAGAAGGFLVFNFGRARIFMGDNGSTFIGIALTCLCLLFLQTGAGEQFGPERAPFILAGILVLPVADMMKVILGRLLRGKSPMKGDRTHIHHLLQSAGLRQKTISILLYCWSFIVAVFFIFYLPESVYLSIVAVVVASIFPYLLMNVTRVAARSKKHTTVPKIRAEEQV